MQRRIVRQRRDGLHPDEAARRHRLRQERIVRLLRGSKLERPLRERPLAKPGGQLPEPLLGALLIGLERLGRRGVGHRVLVLEALLDALKRGREVEDRLAVLDGDHASGREARAVADAIDLVDDGLGDVARPQKIGVERVDLPLRRDGLHRGGERLTEDLSAEDRAPAEIPALAAKEVLFDLFEGEEGYQLVEDARHRPAR